MPNNVPVHNGSLANIALFAPHGLRVGGVDPSDQSQWDSLMDMYPRGSTVDLSVEHPDDQIAQDIATLARKTLQMGRGLFGPKSGELPPERFSQAANFIRQKEAEAQGGGGGHPGQPVASWQKGAPYPSNDDEVDHSAPGHDLPAKVNEIYNAIKRENPDYSKEKAMSIAWSRSGEKHEGSKDEWNPSVSDDMSHLAQFQVVALGELQQPGGVGGTGGNAYNPVTDGPNPDGPSFDDNAGNSPEQEQALETWVNIAVEELNRGETPEAVIARLAHDGCPNPEEVLQRAQQQPPPPVNDSIGQDPFDAPQPPDPNQSGEMQGLSQQPAVQARVRIAGTTLLGTVEETWESMWGEKTVKVALDEGGSLSVAPEALQSVPAGTEGDHPVSEIQKFIDSMPEVQPTRPYIEAHLANLEMVRRAVRSTISKVALSDQVKLQKMDSAAEAESAFFKEVLGNLEEGYEIEYLKTLPRFAHNAFDTADAEISPWAGQAREAGAIWATENFLTPVADKEQFTAAASHFASNLGMNGQQFKAFLAGAEEHRHVTTDEFDAVEEPTTADNEGPAEALFV